MSAVIPFEKRRFRSAARHYLAGRPAYAPALVRSVVQLTGLGRAARVMDLSCGPGQLALAFAPFAGEVLAVDPEPEMLRIAREAAAAAGIGLGVLEASAEEIGPGLGRFDLVAIGRAFHWMDRARVLLRLDSIIEPGGAIALFSTRHPELPDNAWLAAYDALIDRYAAGDEARRLRKSADWPSHEAVLLDSPFARIEAVAVLERRLTPIERFVDRALSLSSTSAARIGERSLELAAALRAALAPFAAEGMIREVVESRAVLAWRPAPAEAD